MEKNVNRFAEELKKGFGDNLLSFALYGSAATGEVYRTSDINTIIVLKDAGPDALKPASGAIRRWVSRGNPAPLMFTAAGLKQSADVFPVEFFDIKDSHRILAGKDLFDAIRISPRNLRLELERELKTLILRLRSAYAMAGGDTGRTRELMARSVSGFVALLRGVIRLYGKKAPAKKQDVIAACPSKLKLNTGLISDILSVKEGSLKPDRAATAAMFASFLKEVERLRAAIDKK